jgi:hypothetical protein
MATTGCTSHNNNSKIEAVNMFEISTKLVVAPIGSDVVHISHQSKIDVDRLLRTSSYGIDGRLPVCHMQPAPNLVLAVSQGFLSSKGCIGVEQKGY